jgi:hypothetical protein
MYSGSATYSVQKKIAADGTSLAASRATARADFGIFISMTTTSGD